MNLSPIVFNQTSIIRCPQYELDKAQNCAEIIYLDSLGQSRIDKFLLSREGDILVVRDNVAQYGAGGYCVMTSGVIDATLYDRLKDIANHPLIEVEVTSWAKENIEDYLSEHPEIRDRYYRLSYRS